MTALINQMPSPNFAHFIHAITELIAAVLDVNSRVSERKILTVDECDA
jgi:hypothetical protein